MNQDELKNLITRVSNIKRPEYQTAILHSSHRHEVEKQTDNMNLFGLDVQYSDYVEAGTVYMVNKPRPKPFEPLPVEMSLEIEKRLQGYIFSAFGLPRSLLEPKVPEYRWQRNRGESVFDWGDRLFKRGLLDNPAIRWEYQKTILGFPFVALKTVWINLKQLLEQG